ncbi:MAG: response regulator [Proteobacteria bacterium]|nr:response regulator [Pseudomonadota bacterium]
MTELNRSVLVVDDEAFIVELWCIYIEMMGLEVCGTAATASDAIRLAQEHRPAVVLMDMRLLGQGDGVDAALAIHAQVGSKVIFITGSQEPETIARIELDHPAAVLIKPVPEQLLRNTVDKVLTESGANH